MQTTLTTAQAVVSMLEVNGIDTIFCLPGVQNDPFFDALYDRTNAIRPIIGILFDFAKMPETAKPRFLRRVNGLARNAEANILQPHSRAEIWRRSGSHSCDPRTVAE